MCLKALTHGDECIELTGKGYWSPSDQSHTPSPLAKDSIDVQSSDITALCRSSSTPTEKGKKKGKKKVAKSEIGIPSDFQHRGHVGWDPEKGFDLNNLDPDLVKVFIQAGINEFHLKDKETSKMIYNVLENKGEINAAQKDAKQKEPKSPDKTVQPTAQLMGPQTFVTQVSFPFQSPPSLPIPTAPPLPSSPPIPPLPPPLPFESTSFSVSKPRMFQEDSGLAKVDESHGRGQLLESIRQGFSLKPVSRDPKPAQPPEDDDIVGALKDVIQKRTRALHSTGDEVSDEDEWNT
eukprot:gi/632946533/ref/XP_007888605.1/ PREDICTED: wiskott-Aldrich syndrome protein-like isoform X1 [Callorhinchus milii]